MKKEVEQIAKTSLLYLMSVELEKDTYHRNFIFLGCMQLFLAGMLLFIKLNIFTILCVLGLSYCAFSMHVLYKNYSKSIIDLQDNMEKLIDIALEEREKN